ncbi:hypothetical protein CGLAMM_04445 [Acetobacteraceae bacterium EV16G]|uniref:Uncharacterized protein n=2 Tax=Sorlinia euscelidii TaxID=3081148 RepID=A0ABU7TZM8_9PROT
MPIFGNHRTFLMMDKNLAPRRNWLVDVSSCVAYIMRAAPVTCGMLILLSSCAPPGQRWFDAHAGRRPEPPRKPVIIQPAPAPFIKFSDDTPEDDWAPVVTKSVKFALARNAQLLFVVQATCPAPIDLKGQADQLGHASDTTLRSLLTVMRAAGADASQILISARVQQNIAHCVYHIDPK